jgi:hypothetical protein
MRDAILPKYTGYISRIFVSYVRTNGYTLKNSVLDPGPDTVDTFYLASWIRIRILTISQRLKEFCFEKGQYFILFNDYCLFDNIRFLLAKKCPGWIRIQVWPVRS